MLIWRNKLLKQLQFYNVTKLIMKTKIDFELIVFIQ